MSKHHINLVSALIIGLLASCTKQLDLKPYEQIQQDQALLTSQDVQITLVGAYNRMSLQDLYGGGVFLYPDLLATQAVTNWKGTFQGLTQMVAQQIPVDNGFVDNVWLYGYEVINQTNNVLTNISKVDTAKKNRIQGEASFLRGLVYFDLVRLFGRSFNDGDPNTNLGVPIVLTPTITSTAASQVPRATVAACYKQAITDLKTAESLLPTSNSFYANSYAASAILGRLYLQIGDYTNALAEVNKVLSTGVYKLNPNYTDEFPYPGPLHVDNTLEDIFAIQFTSLVQGNIANYLNTFYAAPENAGRGDIVVQSNFTGEFDPADTRLKMYNLDQGGLLRCDKFDNTYGNVHVIRLAELYLIRAEANLQLGSAVGDTPLNDVNVIRQRANIAPLTSVGISDVLIERRHELAFEGGFFFHDAKRTAQNIGVLPYNSPKLVFPIPQLEINANPKLVQNPGY